MTLTVSSLRSAPDDDPADNAPKPTPDKTRRRTAWMTGDRERGHRRLGDLAPKSRTGGEGGAGTNGHSDLSRGKPGTCGLKVRDPAAPRALPAPTDN